MDISNTPYYNASKVRAMANIEGISWSDEAKEHIARHGVTYPEVCEASRDIRYQRRSGGYLLIVGQTKSGRYLTVVLDDEGDGIWHPITARDAEDVERRLVRRRRGR